MEGRPQRVATYGERPTQRMYDRILAQRVPGERRILRAADRRWEGNVQRLVDAQNGFGDRAVACFLRRIPPGERSEIHRHNFEAIGYVVKGRGYDIHDGERIEWSEGDALFIPGNVWHQHGNADAEREAVLLLITDWPLLLHLGVCTMEPAATWEEALARPSPYVEPLLAKPAGVSERSS